MHNIHRSKIIVLTLCFLFVGQEAFSQATPKGNYNFWEFRNKPFYFGLTVGLHSTGFIPSKSSEFTRNDTLNYVSGISKPGINLNIITNLKIGQYFDFRFIPGFAYSERRFSFSEPNSDNIDSRSLESVFLELPLLLRFKSAPYKDKRLFVIGGIKYSYDVASNSRVRRDRLKDLMLISPHDFQLEVGAGMQIFLPFFIFSPEIKFSRGLSNIHIYNRELANSTIIDSVLSRAFTISFHFEG